jgi:hypothetical protein
LTPVTHTHTHTYTHTYTYTYTHTHTTGMGSTAVKIGGVGDALLAFPSAETGGVEAHVLL